MRPHAGGPEEAPPGRPVMPPAAALHVEGVEGTERRLLAEATTCRLVPRAVSGDEQAAWRRGVISGDGGTRGGVVLMDWWCARATAARQLKVELSRALPRGGGARCGLKYRGRLTVLWGRIVGPGEGSNTCAPLG